jgi:hypothetical protein
MIAEFLALLFFSRDYAHRAHLCTKSYSVHKALEEFYENLTEALDKLTETYQGRFDLLDIPYLDQKVSTGDPTGVLTQHYYMIRISRYEAVPKAETMLQNQIDEIESIFARTLYKLKNLV